MSEAGQLSVAVVSGNAPRQWHAPQKYGSPLFILPYPMAAMSKPPSRNGMPNRIKVHGSASTANTRPKMNKPFPIFPTLYWPQFGHCISDPPTPLVADSDATTRAMAEGRV